MSGMDFEHHASGGDVETFKREALALATILTLLRHRIELGAHGPGHNSQMIQKRGQEIDSAIARLRQCAMQATTAHELVTTMLDMLPLATALADLVLRAEQRAPSRWASIFTRHHGTRNVTTVSLLDPAAVFLERLPAKRQQWMNAMGVEAEVPTIAVPADPLTSSLSPIHASTPAPGVRAIQSPHFPLA
jgi:hypothetical protein